MTDERATEDDHLAATRAAVIAAALPHVAFDGWTDRTLAEAVEDAGVDPELSRLAFPRGGVDLALAYHYERDAELADDLATADLLGLRFRDRVAYAIMRRLELVADRPRGGAPRRRALRAAASRRRRGAGDLAHRRHHLDRARRREPRLRLVQQARHPLGGLLLGAALLARRRDPGASATREFVARRIDNVMQFEEVKAKIRANPVAAAMLKGPQAILTASGRPGILAPPTCRGRCAAGTEPAASRSEGDHGARHAHPDLVRGPLARGQPAVMGAADHGTWQGRWSSTAPAPSRASPRPRPALRPADPLRRGDGPRAADAAAEVEALVLEGVRRLGTERPLYLRPMMWSREASPALIDASPNRPRSPSASRTSPSASRGR